MKRILCLLLVLLMVCSLCACGKDAPKDDKPDKGGDTTAAGTTTTAGDTDDTTTTTEADGTTTATEGDATTTGNPSTTAGTKAPSTSATKKPTTTASGEDEGDAIRILAIGDNTVADAMEKYLYDLFKSAGYEKIHLGLLYADKSSVETHHTNLKSDKAAYEFRQNTTGKWTKESKVAPSKAFKAAKWDYVILQQATADAGVPASYGKLGDLTALVTKQCGDAAIFWHMGWAYRRQSGLDGFGNYGYNEREMYESIVNTALQQVMRNNDIMGLIPSATTIQNLRTSELRDELTFNGVRLTDYGSYAAALTWYAILTGESAADVTYRPDSIKAHFAELAEAADNAVNTPNMVTPTAAGGGEYKDLRILSIGHSFSLDAMRTYMWDLFDAAGYNVTIGYLYYPSCNLEQHWHYINEGRAEYEQYGKNSNGEWEVQQNVDALTALYDEDWDIVTFQPDPDYGHDVRYSCQWGCNKTIDSDYVHFNQLVDKVQSLLASADNPHGPNTDVKFYYHLTWTWRADCYLYNYSGGHDQLSLYQAFIDATNKNILTNKKILGVIPCNTTIQNARTTWMGDTFNAEGSNDGYHLNDKGDLAAALTWVSYFTGVKAADIHYKTSYTDAEWTAIKEAVDNAIANPQKVTQSKYKTQP